MIVVMLLLLFGDGIFYILNILILYKNDDKYKNAFYNNVNKNI